MACGENAFVEPEWPAPASVRALTTTRRLPGNSQPPHDAFNLGLRTGDDPGAVAANRMQLVRAFALPSAPRWLRQVHGTRALRMTTEVPDHELEADAAFTVQPGVVLAILSADCLPILLCADDGGEVAAIHAGWRGLAAGIIESCVARLRTPAERLLAWIGPAIGPSSYEVGDEVRDVFVATSADDGTTFAANRAEHWLCDLPELARRRLRRLGVEKVYGGSFDTFADPRFYSYRRDGTSSGRFASLIWLVEG